MRVKNKKVVCLLGGVLLVILSASSVFAQGDVEGSKDHPLISRYAGSYIEAYNVVEWDEYILPLGKMKDGKLTKSQKIEGKVYKICYVCPANHTVLQVAKNYELALKNSAFEILFSGTGQELSEGDISGEDIWSKAFPWPRSIDYFEIGPHPKQRHFSAKLSRPEGDVYISLWIGAWDERPKVRLDVIETKPMETGLVTVAANAEVFRSDISKTGHVAIYGIYFDTGKADVKPESEPVLKEIAKLLQQNPKLNLYVVGHTDNVGSLDSNMKLSQSRAEAVVKVLVSKYGVDAKRLKSYGVGPLSPVASNETEEGRAKNRRVELVEQ